MKVEITKEGFAAAIKRHEDEFEKELSEVDVKKIVLKTKKALLEQCRDNHIMRQQMSDQIGNVNALMKTVEGFERQVRELQMSMKSSDKTFETAIELLVEKEKEMDVEINKGILTRLKECWLGWI